MDVLITGATGFVGSELARELLLRRDAGRLALLIRPLAGMTAEGRFERLVAQWRKLAQAPSENALRRVEIISHDLEDGAPLRLEGSFDYVFHAAASTDLGLPLAPARRINLFPTQRIVAAAARLPRLERFVHFSTAYVCGTRRGVAHEDDPSPARFHNFYEQTKRESEDCVRAAPLPWTIVRPSIIVGRSDDGYVLRMKVLYSVWRTWLLGLIPRAPLDPKAWVDIVPVDYVVAASLALAQIPEAHGGTFHLAAGTGRQSPRTIMHAAVRAYGVPTVPLSPPWVVSALRLPFVRPFLAHGMNELLDLMHWHVPYLGIRGRQFDTTRTEALLAPRGIHCPAFADYGEGLFRYCKETAWGKKARAREEQHRCSA